jgi:sirohydrochlorin cobaltochelatase
MTELTTGLLLIAHGARDPAWAGPFQTVAKQLEVSRPELKVQLSFLEFMSPGVEDGAHLVAAQGCQVIHVVPMFLGASGHVRRDIPPLIEKLEQHYGPGIRWVQHSALGEHPGVIQAMTDATLAWVQAHPATPDPQQP